MRNIFKIRSFNQLNLFIKNVKMNSLIKEDFSKLKEPIPYNQEKIEELKNFRKNGLYISELVSYENWEKQREHKKKILTDFMYFRNRYPNYQYISEDTLNHLLIKYNIRNSKTNFHKFKINDRVSADLSNMRLEDGDINFYSNTMSFWGIGNISPLFYTLEYIKRNQASFEKINESTYSSNNVNYVRDTMNILHSPLFQDYIILHPVSRETRRGFLIISTSHEKIETVQIKTENVENDSMTSLIEGIKVKRGKNLSENLTDEEISELIDSL